MFEFFNVRETLDNLDRAEERAARHRRNRFDDANDLGRRGVTVSEAADAQSAARSGNRSLWQRLVG